MLRAGFLPDSKLLYQLDRNDPSDYVTERAREQYVWRLNGPLGGALLNDKAEFGRQLAGLGRYGCAVFGRVMAGRYHPYVAPSDLGSLVERNGRVIVKPTRGKKGQGVMLLDDPDAARAAATEWPDHVVTEYLRQASYARRIFPGSANTIRVLMVRDGDGPFIGAAVHRFGSSSTAGVDNWSAGGFCARIDVDTGQLGPAVAFPNEPTLRWVDQHPDTGAPITGVVVPGWEEVHRAIREAGDKWSFLRHVGWDLIVTDDGPRFIEGNNWADLDLLQVHGGLLRDERLRRFYVGVGMA